MNYRSLLFDWSGTLVDDLPPTLYATNQVLAEYRVSPMDRDEFRNRFRLPYPEFYAEVLPGVPVISLEGTFRTAFQASPEGVTVLPHAREMLSWCLENEIRCFVLSSMDEQLFREQAERFELIEFFEETYAGVIDKREKIVSLLEGHRLVPEETAFIGDMVHDVATAQFGGIDSLAVSTGYDPLPRLQASNPTRLFSDLSKMKAWLAGEED